MANSAVVKAQAVNIDEAAGKDVFRCPCGQCTMETYLKDGCPKSNYPYLEMSKLTRNDKDNLAQILHTHVEDIIERFSDLAITTSESLTEKKVTVDKLKNVVVQRDKSLSEKLRQATSIDAAFYALGEHWSFFNYEILAFIIKRLGDDDDKKNLDVYTQNFESFCLHKIFEVAPGTCGHELDHSREGRQLFVVVAIESIVSNLGDVKRAQHKMATLLGIDSAQLRVHRIDEGSVILVMSVPDLVAQEIFPLTRDKVARLREEGFTIFIPLTLESNPVCYVV